MAAVKMRVGLVVFNPLTASNQFDEIKYEGERLEILQAHFGRVGFKPVMTSGPENKQMTFLALATCRMLFDDKAGLPKFVLVNVNEQCAIVVDFDI
jgi:hypothetical protein